ncbi:MAG: metal-dependent hydrolase [Planctomycetota bacterium]|nr:metal-dependent hydrolase [Planctomycetota bacterium]
MADFKTHITTSTLCGFGLGATAYLGFDYPLDQSLLGAGLCSFAGMLPDLDSDNGIPVREIFGLAAAIVPMLMIDRFQHMGLSLEQMVLAGLGIYLGIRFGVSRTFKRFTVHRGMWHSVPAALLAASLAFFICTCEDLRLRLFKSFAVFLGFCSHLILDEFYSIDWAGKTIRVKRSLGTAIKFWSANWLANFTVYALLIAVVLLVTYDENIMDALGYEPIRIPHTTQDWFNGVMESTKEKISVHSHQHP